MSVTFYPAERCECPKGDEEAWGSCHVCERSINMANQNAMDVLVWLDIPVDYMGEIDATELAAKCRRRLWDVDRNHDPGIPEVQLAPNVVQCERRPGYLRGRTEELLKLAESTHLVRWG